MADRETTLTIHGLDEDNTLVRGEVLAQKLLAFISGLKAADRHVNGVEAHAFIVADMRIGSAQIQVKERKRTKRAVVQSGIEAYEASVKAIYNGETAIQRLPKKLVRSVATLSHGATDKFAHAEIGDGPTILRIDDYLLKQARKAETAIDEFAGLVRPRYFGGIAQTSLDGVLQLLDSRGNAWLAKITTTAGHKEIDCVVNRASVTDIGQYFDQRVIIQGNAHYDRESPIPQRIDIVAVRAVKSDPDLLRWHGAFESARTDDGGA